MKLEDENENFCGKCRVQNCFLKKCQFFYFVISFFAKEKKILCLSYFFFKFGRDAQHEEIINYECLM